MSAGAAPRVLSVAAHAGRVLAGEDSEPLGFRRLDSEEIEHPSEIHRERSRWSDRIGDLYDRTLERCPPVAGTYSRIFDSVLTLEHPILPMDASPTAARQAELCRWSLGRITGLDTIRAHWLKARPRGLSITEVVWDEATAGPFRGAWVPVELIDTPLRRFGFRRRDRALMIRRHGPKKWFEAPPGKFICYQRGTLDSPWGRPELDKVYWPAHMYSVGLRMWSLFNDRFAAPVPWATYPWGEGEGADQQFQALSETTVQALAQARGSSRPEDVNAGYYEPSQNGANTFEAFMSFLARSMSLIILGEIQTAGMKAAHGSFASDTVAENLFLNRVEQYAHSLADGWSKLLLALIVRVNYGGKSKPPVQKIDIAAREERRIRREGLKLARELDLLIAEDDAYSVTGFGRPRPGQQAIEWPSAPPRADLSSIDDVELV